MASALSDNVRSRLAKTVRHARAVAITLVLVLGFVAGWPRRLPKMTRNWPAPLRALALGVGEVQDAILAPFAPVAAAFGVHSEDWPLFTGTGGTRYRMWVEAREKKRRGYTLLYRAHDPEHRYLAGALEYRRVLNLWNPHHSYISDGYPEFVRWLARGLFRRERRFERVRVRMEEVAIRPRGEGFRPTGRFVYELEFGRDEVER